MSTVNLPSLVDQFGNINLQGRAGQVFSIQIADNSGAPVDISSFLYVFEIAGYASIPLTIGADATYQNVTLPDGLFGIPIGVGVPWVLRDVTNTPSVAVGWGLINVYGFETAPP